MAIKQLDCRGMKCPQPILKMTNALMRKDVRPGDILEVTADCSTFENDIEVWCKQWKRVLISMTDENGGAKKATVQI